MTNETQSFHIGMDGFYWWIGIIEDRNDTLKAGRAAVRIIGWHDGDKEKLSTAELPWAYPIMPVNAGTTTPNYKEGDWVVGFFLDGKLGQQPMIFGVLPAVPTPASMLGNLVKSTVKNAVLSYFGVPPGTI